MHTLLASRTRRRACRRARSERGFINVWNNLPHDAVDFSTVKRFKSSLILSDLSKFLQYN